MPRVDDDMDFPPGPDAGILSAVRNAVGKLWYRIGDGGRAVILGYSAVGCLVIVILVIKHFLTESFQNEEKEEEKEDEEEKEK